MSWTLVLFAALALALKALHGQAEHDRRLRVERENFVAYVDTYGPEWERMR